MASKEIRATAEISVGTNPVCARQIASMADGKLLDFEKDFYRMLKNRAPARPQQVDLGLSAQGEFRPFRGLFKGTASSVLICCPKGCVTVNLPKVNNLCN